MPTPPESLPFKEAIEFFRQKIKLPSENWTEIWQGQHSHGFIVAGASKDALLTALYNAINRAKVNGGYEEFKKAFPEIAKKHGWAYNGSPGWRSRIIYDTNVQQAYNAGRYKQMMAVKDLRPYWQYRHTTIEHPRLAHLDWDGLILPADDSWWDTHMPQNGWGCKCRVDSLSRLEASREWEAKGKSGPDEAPPIVWEERTVGKKSQHPRVVSVPKGIDPGFAYNPGKAWLEPHTVPPLVGHHEVLAERGKPWPTKFTPPEKSPPTKAPASMILPPGFSPEEAVKLFLGEFGATLEEGAPFEDAAGNWIAVSKALFVKGSDKENGDFKWLSEPDKAARLKYIRLLALTLKEPDEIWSYWAKDTTGGGEWRLKRRYLKSFEIEGEGKTRHGFSVFEFEDGGWRGATTYPLKNEGAFDKMRLGRLLWKR